MVACLSGGRKHKPIVHRSHAAAQCDALHAFDAYRMRHNRRMTQITQKAPEPAPNIVEWVDEIDSTNSELLRRIAAGRARAPHALAAMRQTQGRGRAGRCWVSPGALQNAENFCLSILIDVAVPLAELAPFTLALGVAARRALLQLLHGQHDQHNEHPKVQLKWPNDLFLGGKKLGGILVEVAKSSAQGCTLVAGIGINLRMPQSIEIDQEFTDLASHNLFVSARELAPIMVAQFLAAANDYAADRLTNFFSEWRAADALAGRALIVSDDPTTRWRGLGISERGGLLLGCGEQVRELMAGEIKVRLGD